MPNAARLTWCAISWKKNKCRAISAVSSSRGGGFFYAKALHLAHEGSDGASEGTFSYYRYENGALRHLETLISLDGWLYSDTTDHYVGGKGFRPVSEDEASAVREKYTYEALSFTSFVV